ncbi:uncharacterized protein EDB93DRAFT_1249088 [Suillus bovinus]|uniref:uncharacterized protein n=1 Tax=Suillus bovinus TaxID=48563 RepID=UPI001B870FE3|nr:uncharacterized protein EDB93DRAFT_1249088 [Suillus bovinus]KAG2152577.1 hypothetical protein EDB93DRAFT_1249088 [Suillus bovinus]
MACRRHVTSESSSSSESESDSDSHLYSTTSFPTLPQENSAPSTEPLKGRKHKSRIDDFLKVIRAIDLTLGLRIPAGFHVTVEAGDAEYQTSNKSVHIDEAVIEWHERALLPCEPSSKVRVSVYASFELSPMSCYRELLRTFEIFVRELLDRMPRQEEVVSAHDSFDIDQPKFSNNNSPPDLSREATTKTCASQGIAGFIPSRSTQPASSQRRRLGSSHRTSEGCAELPPGRSHRSVSLNTSALQLSTRFKHQHNGEDLDELQEILCCVLVLSTQHARRRSLVYKSLVTVYLIFHHSGLDRTSAGDDVDSLNTAVHHFKAAAYVVSESFATSHGSKSILGLAYATSGRLHVHDGFSIISTQCHKFFQGTLVVDAGLCARRSGDTCRAVELLEQGRTTNRTQFSGVKSVFRHPTELLWDDVMDPTRATRALHSRSLVCAYWHAHVFLVRRVDQAAFITQAQTHFPACTVTDDSAPSPSLPQYQDFAPLAFAFITPHSSRSKVICYSTFEHTFELIETFSMVNEIYGIVTRGADGPGYL